MSKSAKVVGHCIKNCMIIVVVLLTACDSKKPVAPVLSENNLVHLEQGWEPDTRVKIHHTSFGSRLIPFAWALHLENEKGQKLLSDESVEQMGFLIEQASKLNPLALPVGFTQSQDDKGVNWIGLGCAACHTGEVHFNGHKIRLEGGQGLVNFNLFELTVLNTIKSTLADADKLGKFKQRLQNAGEITANIETLMKERIDYLQTRQQFNATTVDYGYGRLDAFGQIFNTVGVELLAIPENRLTPDAPVSYPVLWDTAHLDLVQWNGSAPNTDPGPLLQNITTAIAVYGQIEVVNNQQRLGYKSSVNIRNLKKIENWLYQLRSPQWPQEILGEIDQSLAMQGAEVYQKNCINCHTLVDRKNKRYKLKAVLTPVTEVGTDPMMVNNYLKAKMNSGVLQGKKVLWLAGDKISEQASSLELVAHVAVGAALNHPLQTIGAILGDYHPVYKAAIDKHPDYYKARPLTGIWSSSPYLHNGSVLTLSELLSPENERRKKFFVGDRNLDIERIGLVSSEGPATSLFDTNLIGNSNQGHIYGTTLAATDKQALLEYLKSL